ncbi:peptidylprolyl isomerase [Chamaesiphon sp. VAR_48_metabat_403]|uniref:peptidylprolyl isomerase n=1 Tax=Chamaesiphon sp. VAR_48_metabat_403 TaxID=2964700 RepID=UPI00286D91D4|nr:peptidylprolyl isomerase [Chamaesiphon sp. VAR_48_metabat_403]
MSSTVQVGKRTFTTDAICEQLSNSALLPQLLREMIIDEILAEWETEIDGKIPYNREEFAEGCDRISRLAEYQGLNQLQLYKIVDRHLKLQKFKQARWAGQVYSYYLKRKSVLDRVEFSIIQVNDLGLAKELFFRVQRGEQSFAELAFEYSQGNTAKDGGRVSATDIERTFPALSMYLLSLKKDEISPIFTLDNLHTFLRLERYILAELDDNLNRVLLDELFDNWIQQQISTRLGLFAVEDSVNDPELTEELDLVSERSGMLPSVEIIEDRAIDSDLMEPTSSFFFPKLTSAADVFDDRQYARTSSSFFVPQSHLARTIVRPRRFWNRQKAISFLCFFCMFLGLEIVALKMFHRLDPPQISIGNSRN